MEENPLLSLEKEWRKIVESTYGLQVTFGLWPWDDPEVELELDPPLREGDVLVELIDWSFEEGRDMVLPVRETVDRVMNGLKTARPDLNFRLVPYVKPHP